MEFSLSWLAQYVDLPEITTREGGDEIARRLTAAGLAVENADVSFEDERLFDVEVTTNRPDCMNHLGLARELAVILGRELRPPAFELTESSEKAADAISIEIEEPTLCPRYAARIVRGVRVGPSPAWLAKRLQSIGLRSINNVVDVSNFVLWETGQPLHAFDLAKIEGAKIVVRRARVGETLQTLDGVERKLEPEMLVIADGQGPVALAGVMGGLLSETTAATVDLLIESAHFDRRAVRTASKKLGLHTDASHRFERGTDLEACAWAAERAAALIVEVAGGQVLAGTVDARVGEPRPVRRGLLDLARFEAFAGFPVPAANVERWLQGLGFEPRAVAGDSPAWEVRVPSWRWFDVEARPDRPEEADGEEVFPADLFEEILRLHGFETVPSTLPAIAGADAPKNPVVARRHRAQLHIAACGFAEAIHYAFGDPAEGEALPGLVPEARVVRLVNPLSDRLAVMRRSLLPGLVESARFNQRRGASSVRLFEVGRVFYGHEDLTQIPDQPERIGWICGGRVGTPWERERDLDFFDLKGVIESLAETFGVKLSFRATEIQGFLAGSSAEILRDGIEGAKVGIIGRLATEEGYPLFAAELASDALWAEPVGFLTQTDGYQPVELLKPLLTVEAPSRFPGISADLTLTHSSETAWREIESEIHARRPELLIDFGLKDRYRGKGVPDGAVNTTIYFLYNAADRSLTQDEVNEWQRELAAALEARFGWRA